MKRLESKLYLVNPNGEFSRGIVGTPTPLTALGNEPLFVGDVVEVYEDYPGERRFMGLNVIWAASENIYSVSELAYHDFQNGRSSDSYWLIIKRNSFTEMNEGDVIDEVRYASGEIRAFEKINDVKAS